MNENTKHNEGNQPDVNTENTSSFSDPSVSLRPGMTCPRCLAAKINYNEMINLICPKCGLTETGSYT